MSVWMLLMFAGASVMLALSPGPDIVSVITRSITQGTRAGLAATLGFASGLTVHTALAAAILEGVIKAGPTAFLAVRWFGAAYLLYLAIRNALDRQAFVLEAAGTRRGLWSVFGQSALMNVLNPKVTLFFLAFMPRFVVRDPAIASLPIWLQVVILGAVFAICTLLVFGACAVFAGGLSGWLRRKPAITPWLRWGTSALFVAVAIWILVG